MTSVLTECSFLFCLFFRFFPDPGKFVDLPTTINSFKRIAAGEFDHLPEQAFYMVRKTYPPTTQPDQICGIPAAKAGGDATVNSSPLRRADDVNFC
jgi:hypothetical protein